MNIRAWLESLALARHAEAFAATAIDLDTLPTPPCALTSLREPGPPFNARAPFGRRHANMSANLSAALLSSRCWTTRWAGNRTKSSPARSPQGYQLCKLPLKLKCMSAALVRAHASQPSMRAVTRFKAPARYVIFAVVLSACTAADPSEISVTPDEHRVDPSWARETGALAAQPEPAAVGVSDLGATFDKAMKLYERSNQASPFDFAAAVRDHLTAGRMLRPVADLLRQHAEQGDVESQYMLGKMYSNGLGVKMDHTQAVKWYRKAADQGHVEAQFWLGYYYDAGLGGLNRDDAEAMRRITYAAERGLAIAQVWLGLMYDIGEAVPQDHAEAAKWFLKAADQGEATAQGSLARLYYYGLGVKQDYAEAVTWYRKSAAQGNTQSQIALGEAYLSGRGAEQNYSGAAHWFREAAEAGYVRAQHYLGLLYDSGLGVPQDYVEAHKWWNLAASRYRPGQERDLYESLRNDVAKRMTPDQIAEAQRLARDWKPNRYRCEEFSAGGQ